MVAATAAWFGPGIWTDYAHMWFLPISAILLGLAGIPGSALLPIAFGARLLWRLNREESTVMVPGLAPAQV